MNILYHHRTLADGAEGIHIQEMVAAFRQLGHRVRIVSPVGEEINRPGGKAGKLEKIKKKIPRVFFECAEIGYTLVGFFKIARAIFHRRPDFIYERYITFNGAGILASWVFRIPLILEVNAPLALERSRQPDEKLYLAPLAFCMESFICRHATHVVCVSTPLKAYLVDKGVNPAHCHVLPNGVNHATFDPALFAQREEVRRELGVGSDTCVVAFSGIMRPWHRIDMLVDAFSRLRREKNSCFLLIIGDGPIRREIEERLLETVGAHDFRITGRVPHQAVARFLCGSDCAVSPDATFYASPMKIIEYMALKKAVVAPAMDNIRDIIEDGRTGVLFTPRSTDDLEAKLRQIVTDASLRERIGKNGEAETHERLNWENNARRVLAMVTQAER